MIIVLQIEIWSYYQMVDKGAIVQEIVSWQYYQMVYAPIRIHPRELNAQNKWMQQTSRKGDKPQLGGKGTIVQEIVSW